MWLIEDDKYAKMEASVSGKVLHTDGAEMTIECKNGKLVKVVIDPIDEFKRTKSGKTGGRYRYKDLSDRKALEKKTVVGNKVAVEGWCYFCDGEIVVFACAIEVTFRNGCFALYFV